MQRRAEFDALRGLLLVLMALTHLPTRLNGWVDQPFGFVSTAEWFVLVSAFIAGRAYTPLMLERGITHVQQKLWRRAFKLYRLHIVLLLFAVITAVIVAAASGRPGLRNLLSFYFASPGWAALTAPLLLYQPPLLDVLPMYILFLAITPFVLQASRRFGWSNVLGLSIALWVFAQFGGQMQLHGVFLSALPVPPDARGAFDWLAWQLVWIGGLWLGSARAVRITQPLFAAAIAVCSAFFLWRHGVLDRWLSPDIAGPWLDKWHLGPLRVINVIALLVVGQRVVLPLLASLRLNGLQLLGRGSLEAFAAHLVVCILSLNLIINEQTPLSTVQQIAIVAIAFAAMWLAARKPPPRIPIQRGVLE